MSFRNRCQAFSVGRTTPASLLRARQSTRVHHVRVLDVEMRAATREDADAIADLLWGDPSGEATALVGSPERARQFGRLVDEASTPPPWTASVVAVGANEVCGFLSQGPAEDGEFQVTPAFVRSLVRAWGFLTALRLLPRGLAQQRVQIAAPPGSWLIREVHVAEHLRGQGIGGLLLERAEECARANGRTTIALTTRTNNPARRLYERRGYQVVKERTNPSYCRHTGADGRILMVNHLN
jgi:ribosomal protein S18 acetylase RimI-like enzyme